MTNLLTQVMLALKVALGSHMGGLVWLTLGSFVLGRLPQSATDAALPSIRPTMAIMSDRGMGSGAKSSPLPGRFLPVAPLDST